MTPAWYRESDDKWAPCWLISTAPHGGAQGHVMIAIDDKPGSHWGYPGGSLRIQSASTDRVRIRRDVIPLMEKPNGDQSA